MMVEKPINNLEKCTFFGMAPCHRWEHYLRSEGWEGVDVLQLLGCLGAEAPGERGRVLSR